MDKKYTSDGRMIVAPTQAPDGWRTFITSASDDPSSPTSKNGTGPLILLDFSGPENKSMDIVLANPVFLHNGKLQREGSWSVSDTLSLSAIMPPTSFQEEGNKDVTFVDIGGGAGYWIPSEPGQGTHSFDQSLAIPVPSDASLPHAATWNVDETTSDLLPVFGSSGSAMLVNFPLQGYFARSVSLGENFYSDADQSEWLSQKWTFRLEVSKVSPGAGSVAGVIFTYRRSTS